MILLISVLLLLSPALLTLLTLILNWVIGFATYNKYELLSTQVENDTAGALFPMFVLTVIAFFLGCMFEGIAKGIGLDPEPLMLAFSAVYAVAFLSIGICRMYFKNNCR